jgi:hypothetical protein
MTDHYPWQPPQDEWHRRVLELEDGLLPRRESGGRSTGHTARPPIYRSPHRPSGIRRHVLRAIALGAVITTLLAIIG